MIQDGLVMLRPGYFRSFTDPAESFFPGNSFSSLEEISLKGFQFVVCPGGLMIQWG